MSFSKAWDKAKPVKANELKKKTIDETKKKQSTKTETSNGMFGTKGDNK